MSKPEKIDVMIYALTGLSSLQIGLTGEVIKRVVDENKSYKIVRCDSALHNCHFNQFHNILACASCQSRMSFIHNKIGVPAENLIKLKPTNPKLEIPYFSNYQEVIAYEYQGVNIGRGVASSLISHYRDYELNSEKRGEYISYELEKAAIVVDNFMQILQSYVPDEFIIFNGRFAEIHPLIEICKQKNIPFKTIESGSKLKFEYFENSLPHSINNRNERMHQLWTQADPVKRAEIGHDWFIKKRKGDETYERSFKRTGESNDKIDSLIDSSKENVLILNSSEDELKVIKEWNHGLYENQNDAILKLIHAFEGNEAYNFILRIHPNLQHVDNQQTRELAAIDNAALKIIKANEELDTYELIDKVDKVLVFGSSTGIESTYWGKPTILFGKSFYYHLDVCYKPSSYEEMFALLAQKDLKPFPQENCLIYGFYFATYGNELQWFVPKGKAASIFMGDKIPMFDIEATKNVFKYLNGISVWKRGIKAAYNRNINFSDILRYKMHK